MLLVLINNFRAFIFIYCCLKLNRKLLTFFLTIHSVIQFGVDQSLNVSFVFLKSFSCQNALHNCFCAFFAQSHEIWRVVRRVEIFFDITPNAQVLGVFFIPMGSCETERL